MSHNISIKKRIYVSYYLHVLLHLSNGRKKKIIPPYVKATAETCAVSRELYL